MKVPTSMFLKCALYTVLVFMPPMLAAAEVANHKQDGPPRAPRLQEREAGAVTIPMRLHPAQLDSIRAGQLMIVGDSISDIILTAADIIEGFQ
jgi:hypothetical protein